MSFLRSSLFRSLCAGFLVGAGGLWLAQPDAVRAAWTAEAGQMIGAIL